MGVWAEEPQRIYVGEINVKMDWLWGRGIDLYFEPSSRL